MNLKKAVALARKFHDKYGIGCSPAQRITRKQKGLANVALVMYWPGFDGMPVTVTEGSADQRRDSSCRAEIAVEPDAEVAWLLLVTVGTGPVTEQESLRSVLKDRLNWLGYELVRLPKRGGVSWTWRRLKSAMADWYALLGDQLAHRRLSAVAETLRLIANQPGFAGVRRQSWELVQFARSRGYSGETPFLFHMEKVAHGAPLRLA